MEFSADKLYVVEGTFLQFLLRLQNHLYGDGTHLTPDQRRDLANALNAHLHSNISEYPENIGG